MIQVVNSAFSVAQPLSSGTNGVTPVGPLNTKGATLIVLMIAGKPGTYTITDTFTNTWVAASSLYSNP